MIFCKRFFTFMAMLIMIVISTGCRDMLHDVNEISTDVPELKSIRMIDINDVSNFGTEGLDPYRINAYETTYLLWYEVAQWAKENGFNIIKPAEDGDTGFTGKPGVYAYFPVTGIHPADIFVWCNALSVKNGLTPVYYKDKDFLEILKDAADIAKENYRTENDLIHDMNGNPLIEYDFSLPVTFYQNLNANGYRLPTVDEWQYAAQGARRTNEDKSYAYSGSNDMNEVAASTKLRIPGSLKPNGIGAYDMSGNICEYSINEDTVNFTVTDSAIHCYGGHYLQGNSEIYSVQRLYDLKGIIKIYSNLFGFRLAQSI
ncbi:MAG: SUMF1/EgtB/PvdO family nonheme iron enzyme [Treponema sp.]|nr:SUMF1/EgtB/PvdO family nonheme iron enzyme [Treponema sp.]